MTTPYNPLDMDNIAESIGEALLRTPPAPLEGVARARFTGAGIYAIYYIGDFPPYDRIRDANESGQWSQPIYVGKAIPEGGRMGRVANDPVAEEIATQVRAPRETTALRRRLSEHRSSVIAAENLDVADFAYRWLVIEPIWIPLGETLLITRYAPVWNRLVDGFGNHDPGAGRRRGMRSRWDTLHPGRAWAPHFGERPESADDIAQDVTEYLRSRMF
jgi:hypothetical protein